MSLIKWWPFVTRC